MAEATGQRRRAGRPRLRPAASDDRPAREEILDSAASLFVTRGLAATTTRQIADQVGIRQASLYYYFGGKDEILLELLTRSVRPSLSAAASVESACGSDAAAGLYALVLIDVETLARAPHNIPMLYLSPEVQGEAFEGFRAERASLQAVYARLGAALSPGVDPALGGTLIMQLVESVIQLRRLGPLKDGYGHQIAAACLRLAGLPASEIDRAREAAGRLVRASRSR